MAPSTAPGIPAPGTPALGAPAPGTPASGVPAVQQPSEPGDTDISIEDNGDGTFSIYYTVKEAGDYKIQVKYGGQNVPNGIYKIQVSHLWFIFQTMQRYYPKYF